MNFFRQDLRKFLEQLKLLQNLQNQQNFTNDFLPKIPLNNLPQFNQQTINNGFDFNSQESFAGNNLTKNIYNNTFQTQDNLFPQTKQNNLFNKNRDIFNNDWNLKPKKQEQIQTFEMPKQTYDFEKDKKEIERQKNDVLTPKPMELKPLGEEERHKKAREFKDMFSDIGDNLKNEQKLKEYNKNGWTYLDHRFDKDSNYKAVAMKNDQTGEIAIFNMGTNKWNRKDQKANWDMIRNKSPQQFDKANEYHKELRDLYGKTYKINSIGHSEGGSESQYVGLFNKDTDVYTFNAYGIGRNKELQDQIKNSDLSNIYNYRDSRDPVSKHGKNIGKEYVVESEGKRILPFGYLKYHGIKNMGNIVNPTEIEEYKKKHPKFVNDMQNMLLTSEDVGQMDSDTFDFYEPYIDELLRKGLLLPSYELEKRIAKGAKIRRYNGHYQLL